MTVEEIKAIIKRFVEEPWNKGDMSVIDEFCDTNYTVGILNSTEFGDRESLKRAITQYRATSPHLHAEFDEIIVEGDRVAYTWTMKNVMEQGKLVNECGITILHFSNGKIVKDRFLAT